MSMTVGSLFSGVGGFDLGFVRAGFAVRWQCEIDRDARDVLCRQFPECEVIYSDVRTINSTMLEPVDLICGGFPCQDVSVAGRRAGLDGERSGLWHEYHRVLREMRPAWCVIENVPGLLSSCGCATCGAVRRLLRVHAYLRKKRGIHQPCALCRAGERMLASHRGRDFAIILRGLVELGYGVSWRILDAQYNGVPQRRRRLFLVGHLGDGRAAEVLFEPACVPGNHPPRREAREGAAAFAVRRAQTSSNGWGVSEDAVHTLDETGGDAVIGTLAARDHKGVSSQYVNEGKVIAHALTAHAAKGGDPTTDNYIIAGPILHDGKRGYSPDDLNFVTHSLTADGHDASEDGTGRGTPIIAFGHKDGVIGLGEDVTPTLRAREGVTASHSGNGGVSIAYQQQGTNVGEMGTLRKGNGNVTGGVPFMAFGVTDDTAYSLRANPSHSGDKGDGGINTTMVSFNQNSYAQDAQEDQAGSLSVGHGIGVANAVMGVRRLTPTECERLMSWDDDHTKYGASGKEMSDSTRYRMCGNGVVSNVAEWIARRIAEVTA